MSFLTEYFDEYREHPIRRTQMCRPENRWAQLKGKWLDPRVGTQEKELTDEQIRDFIKQTMKSLRGQSTYYNDYCAHLSPEFKTRPFKPREKKLRPCKPQETTGEEKAPEDNETLPPSTQKLALRDTELMKVAKDMYERDMNKPTLRPISTHPRLFGYIRPSLFKTGLSDYQEGIARLAYELIRDDRFPRFHAHNGGRPQWGLPPEGTRQPLLDVAPYDGERLY